MSGVNVRLTDAATTGRTSRRRAAVVVWDVWHGAQVRAVNGNSITLRIHLDAHRIGDRVVAASLFTQSPPAVGNPCQVRTDDAYTVLEVQDAPPADTAIELAYLRDGVTFSPGRIQQPGLSEVY